MLALNGASSAGKSSLAPALQARWESCGACWLVFRWDDFVPRLPNRWRGTPGLAGDLARDSCAYTVVGGARGDALLEVSVVGGRVPDL